MHLARSVSQVQRTVLQQGAALKLRAVVPAVMRGSQAGGSSGGSVAAAAASTSAGGAVQQWADTPLQTAKYAKELDTACLAVQLASKLCRTVQQQLSSSEKQDKQDDSPVTVADYGGWVCMCVDWTTKHAVHVCAGVFLCLLRNQPVLLRQAGSLTPPGHHVSS